jgi:iron(II)-dependent oxidoreductase
MEPFTPASADVRPYVELLSEARVRTLLLVSRLSPEDLRRQHDKLMSPVLWDLGHIASFEKLWLLHNTGGPIEFFEMPGIYNPFEHPRATRAELPLPDIATMLDEMAAARRQVLDRLASAELDWDHPLLRGGYVFHMVAQHEYQHGETILQTLKLKQGEPYHPPRVIGVPAAGRVAVGRDGMVRFPGGRVVIGTSDHAEAYDNERPEHVVELPSFWMDVAPVTNAHYQQFIHDGGYRERRHWSEAGWAWLQQEGATAPKYWEGEGDEWMVRSFDRLEPPEADHPVCHVCWHEADAYARWAGKRLPSEQEWEAAASWDPFVGRKRRYPWGDEHPTALEANLDQLTFSTAPVGAYPHNLSPIGCYGMIGDVWEWTSSDFTGYPGFSAFPYAEYSEAFFGSDYKVLRGGSWATRPGAVRNTFRNWDYPIRRQIYSGFRCAQDD